MMDPMHKVENVESDSRLLTVGLVLGLALLTAGLARV